MNNFINLVTEKYNNTSILAENQVQINENIFTIFSIKDANKTLKYSKKENEFIFFEDEWCFRTNQCLSIIDSKINLNTKIINGRDCEVKLLNKETANIFLDQFHIQGSNTLSLVRWGLFYENKLIGLMSLGRHHRQNTDLNLVVLDRLCFRSGYRIRGGASKLFSRCLTWAKEREYDEIISFSDNRFSNGNVYKALNFSLQRNQKSDYSYFDSNNLPNRLSKQSQKKKNTKCPDHFTEFYWAGIRGLIRIYDCGKKRWSYKLNPNKLSWNEITSYNCAKQHANGVFKHSHIRGYYESKKSGSVYFSSSYELRCQYLLDQDENVISFKRCEVFKGVEKFRNPDLYVIKKDGVWIYEVKPNCWLDDESVLKQIADNKKYAHNNNFNFKVWSEDDSLLDGEKEIIKWATNYCKNNLNLDFDWVEKQKDNSRKSSKKYYENHIKEDTIKVFCNYCSKEHEILKLSYDQNIEKNEGKFLCSFENGHIQGSKPKLHLRKENPYALEGKKQCANKECGQILPFSEFNNDKGRLDGLSRICKKCNKIKSQERYYKKKKIIN